ncbi:protein sprouty1-like [Scleropages formosus]|uniref:Protein sprouty homolog 1 n=1 Tax=Scleropages formosus TaxID=113540 RepID=A0A0P7V0J2_SCLFO|nr:protein sprouty homolog 1 [Scleropages formosus]XP_029108258.1 protein sprouty homolog 1 [Scleropages formosus]XP_029108259.1 protein sprouty homolog 1 [Scleropages formosus]XP_029108260.1 protein sprouty homolog 1 [Scleropages formosus]KPP74469.1 protein sprouty1-like [Scleropages formosus]
MELQSQHGTGGSLVAIQQPSSDSRQRLDYERELQHAAILSLDQIKAIRSNNEYTEGPSVARRPTARTAQRPEKQERTHQVIHVNVNNNYEHRVSSPLGPYPGTRGPVLSRSTSTGSAASSGSGSSASSEQGLLPRSLQPRPGPAQRVERPVRTQPKAPAPPEDSLKPAGRGDASGHRFICERCGRCKCGECTAPRTLPSCLACRGLCLCSPESAVEHGTCMCLVKGIFYHCSNDDEGDSCADSPCSLSRSHCCSRFLCMGLMSVLFPCLLCYPPAKGCVKACQGCYDRVSRPGCRCKNSNTVYCKLDSWSPRGQEKPA